MIIQLEEAKIRLRQIMKELEELAQALKIKETEEKIFYRNAERLLGIKENL